MRDVDYVVETYLRRPNPVLIYLATLQQEYDEILDDARFCAREGDRDGEHQCDVLMSVLRDEIDRVEFYLDY